MNPFLPVCCERCRPGYGSRAGG